MRPFSLVRHCVAILTIVLLPGLSAQPTEEKIAEPSDPIEAKFRAAGAKQETEDYSEAIDLYSEIIEAKPVLWNAWINRAIARWKAGDVLSARADLALVIAQAPDSIAAYRVRASIRMEAEDNAGALADIEQALKYEPEAAQLHLFRAGLLTNLARKDEALAALARAIELDPQDPVLYLARGELLEKANQIERARADYSKAVELAPKEPVPLEKRAWLEFHAGEWKAATADLDASLALNEDQAPLVRLRGYLAFASGGYTDAAKLLAEAAGRDKDNAAYPLLLRHFSLLRQSAPDDRLASAVAKWPGDAWTLALARFALGQLSEDALDEAAHDGADDDDLKGRLCEEHFYIGLMRKQAGDKSTARLRFQSAVATAKTTFIEHTLAKVELTR